jgi:hypothetical protein
MSSYYDAPKPKSDDDTQLITDTQLIVVKSSRSARSSSAFSIFIVFSIPFDLTSIRQLVFALDAQLL